MRGELIDLLSRYVELDKELLELDFQQEGDQVALMLSIPVIRAKDEAEIDAAIALKNGANTDDDSDEGVKDGANEGVNDEIIEEEVNDEVSSEDSEDIQTVTAPEEMTASKKEEEMKECKTEA